MRIWYLIAASACLALVVPAKERNWIAADLVRVEESQVESEDLSYKSSSPNNTMNGPLRPAEVEKHSKRVYTYTFRGAGKQYTGSSNKAVEGLKEGTPVGILVKRGWLIIHMPDGKEKKIEFIE